MTSRFGSVDISEELVITFPKGLYGFERYKEFCLIDNNSTPYRWLQSVGESELAFVVASPFEFFPDYDIEVDDVEMESLPGIKGIIPDILCIVNVSSGVSSITMNLKAPLLIFPSVRLGAQVILQSTAFLTKSPLPVGKRSE